MPSNDARLSRTRSAARYFLRLSLSLELAKIDGDKVRIETIQEMLNDLRDDNQDEIDAEQIREMKTTISSARIGDLISELALPQSIIDEKGGWIDGKYFCIGAHKNGTWGWMCTETRTY